MHIEIIENRYMQMISFFFAIDLWLCPMIQVENKVLHWPWTTAQRFILNSRSHDTNQL